MSTIGDLLSKLAQDRGSDVALIDERQSGGRLTYAQLEEEVARAAGWLRQAGLKRGDAVLVFVPMSSELYVALLAMFRLGVVALFLDPTAGREHMNRCCERWKPAALLAVSKAHLLRLTSAALRDIPLKIYVGFWVPFARQWLSGAAGSSVRASSAEPDDAALVTFTSGSTGVPKAAVRTHAFLLAQYRALAPNIALTPGDTDLATLPVFTLANLGAGITTVIPTVNLRRPGDVDAAKLVQQVECHRVNRITASPALFERLIEYARATQCTYDGLRKLHTGGAPVFPRLLEGLRKVAPRAQVVAVYGSTEAEPIAHLGAEEISEADLNRMRQGHGLLAGRAVDEIKVLVLKDRWGTPRGPLSQAELETDTMPAESIGEIVVSGDHVLKGYLGGIGDAETKFRVEGETWHRTGDAGFFDQQGRLWLVGRCSAKIEDSQGRLYPFGTECAAMCFEEVVRAAVVSHRQQRVLVLQLSPRANAVPPELEKALAWAHIERVHVVKQMPLDKRHNAKIDYPALRRLLESELR